MTVATAADQGIADHDEDKKIDQEIMPKNDSSRKNTKPSKKAQVQSAASISDTLSFMFDCGTRCKILFYVGVLAGGLNGLVYPAMAYLFSDTVEELAQSGGVTSMDSMREMALRFVYIGFYTFGLTAIQSSCLELASNRAKMAFTSQWFSALLRQDPAFFDVHNISGVATQIGPMAEQYARGVGPKFGEIAEYLSAAVGGMVYAYYSSWKVALVVTCSIPLVSIFAVVTAKFNTTKSRRSAIAYKKASSVAYTAVSAMKTVSSLNAAGKMIQQYARSTQDGLRMAVNSVIKQGLAYGAMTGSFCSAYVIVTLFGAYALYSQVPGTSCDPSAGVPFNESCAVTGQEVMAALVGVLFAAMGIAQLGTSTESLSIARVAAHEALTAIRRKPGAEEEILYCSTMDMGSQRAYSSTSMVNGGPKTKTAVNREVPERLTLVRSNSMLSTSSLIPAMALAASMGSNVQIIHNMSYEIEAVYMIPSEEEMVLTEIEPIMESDETSVETGPNEEGIKEVESGSDGDLTLATTRTSKNKPRDSVLGNDIPKAIKAILPKYEIDVSSTLGLRPTEINGAISMNNVQFSYPTRPSVKILNGLTVDIKPGETVAFVGPSGGGKSTIAALLERFYDPTAGSVTLDGVDIRELNVAHLRGLIGYVGQEPTLFATSIRNNIQYGNPDATQEQIETAARMANAHDFIESFSDGYDTQVGNKGSQLSGGQKQRIAIARVLVANPKILLLDEATSALDSESELVVQHALDNILAQKKVTTIVIAHRLSTIRNADRINVVVSGEIAEKGTHDELMSFDGYYRALVEKQEGPAAIEKKESDNGSTPGSSVKDEVASKEGGSREENPAGSSALQDGTSFPKHTRSRSQPYGGKSNDFNTPAISPGRSQSLSALGADNPGSAIESESDLRKPESRKITPCATEESAVASAPSLSFKNVRFAYPTRPYKNVLDGFSLDLREGQTVALVGPSGGGKSTTVGLLERFYDPLEGSVEYMGHDLKSLNVAWYRDQIGFVGQEPTLFDETIAENVAYGMPGATQEQIEEACRKSYAHDFISKFPHGYQTKCGERGAQLSGGQKQRIAIARALIKNPKILILDEATSALDNESEGIVQAAIERLIESKQHTVVLIAHRLSTIKNADKIAFIAEGKVQEFGSHEELLRISGGRYRRLVKSSKLNSTMASAGLTIAGIKDGMVRKETADEEEIDWEATVAKEAEDSFDLKRAKQLAKPDIPYLIVGTIGALMAGATDPAIGLLFAEMTTLFFRPVFPCPLPFGFGVPFGFETCPDYLGDTVNEYQQKSFQVAIWWAILGAGKLTGNVLMIWGFGIASERLSKRVRDMSFTALLRQEIAYFDKRAVGVVTSQLQDDASRLHAFSGEPFRVLIVGVTALITGITLSFIYMWPFALLALACVPFMGVAMAMRVKKVLGVDETSNSGQSDELNHPSGIIVETLLHMRTVSALNLEKQRYEAFEKALNRSNQMTDFMRSVRWAAFSDGLGRAVQRWIMGLEMWFGGYLMYKFPDDYDFHDFMVSIMAMLFALIGFGAALSAATNRDEAKQSASRIFYLLDRKPPIDQLDWDVGVKLD